MELTKTNYAKNFSLLQIFILLAQFLNYVTSNFCTTCNCCFSNKVENPLKNAHSASIFNDNILLQRQNDDAYIPPNPKPLVTEQSPKFYKISAADNQAGIMERVPFNILNGARPPLSSQAILFPVPVAALIVQPFVNNPKCICPTESTITTTSTYNPSSSTPSEICSCEQKKNKNGCEQKCEKNIGEENDAEGLNELENEKAADEVDGKIEGEYGHELGEEEADCHSENEKEESREHVVGAEAIANEQSRIMCQECEKKNEKGGYECNSNGVEGEGTIRKKESSQQQNEYYHQEQKIPIEVFKKFVAKNTGVEVPSLIDSEGTMPQDKMHHEDSFENLKERLKEISNKMDLLKNLSMEMKGFPRQLPMGKFINGERIYGNNGLKMDERALQARIFGSQYLPAGFQHEFGSLNQQKSNQYTQNHIQFEPTTSITTTRKKLPKVDGNNEKMDGSILKMSSTPITATTINHQQFLLNAIEEFLRESQKVRDKELFIANTTKQQLIVTKKPVDIIFEHSKSTSIETQTKNTPSMAVNIMHQIHEDLTPISSLNTTIPNIASSPFIAANNMNKTTTALIGESFIENINSDNKIIETTNPSDVLNNKSHLPNANKSESNMIIESLRPTPEPFNPQIWFHSLTTNKPMEEKILTNFPEETTRQIHEIQHYESTLIENTGTTQSIDNSSATTTEPTIQQPMMADQPSGNYQSMEAMDDLEIADSYESVMSLKGNKTVRRSDSMKKKPLGTSRLINLITSIKTRSDEIGHFGGILKNPEQLTLVI